MRSTMSATHFDILVRAIFVACIAFFAAGIAAAAEDAPAIAVSVQGAAEFVPDTSGLSLPLKTGARVPSGSVINVPEGSLVTLRLPDSHVVKLGPAATSVKWERGRIKSTTVTVYRGQTSHSIQRLGEREAYRVVTPSHVAGVRGTEFDVLVADDFASMTKVASGAVKVGTDELSNEIGANDAYEASIDGGSSSNADGDWFTSHGVAGAAAATLIEAAAARRMRETNRLSIADYAEMAQLTTRLISIAARPPRDASDAANIASALEDGLRIWQRMELRRETMETRHKCAQMLAGTYGVSDTLCSGEFSAYSSSRSSKAESIEKFANTLEKLSSLLKTASIVSNPAVGAGAGLLRRLPW